MSEAITIDTSSGRYEVVLGDGVLDRIGELCVSAVGATHVALITDANVGALFAETVAVSLAASGIAVDTVTVPAGEESKNWAQAGELLEHLADLGLDRTGCIVALGGGVVGDLAGFCAAVYMRGISFVQVPTTLLALVDSSVGGKTAVDLEAGKNLAGAFLQPKLVVADTSVVQSLPETEWKSGLAEVAKSGILDSERLMTWMEQNATGLCDREPDCVVEAVRECVAFKGRVVVSDERESGERESLNYGHTFGHALESVLGYGVIPHGLAVAEGIRFAADLAQSIGLAPESFSSRQGTLLDRLGLCASRVPVDSERLRAAMYADKKVRDGQVRFVLVPEPGAFTVKTIDDDVLRVQLSAWFDARKGTGK